MNTTIRLFDQDAYATEFDGKVLSITPVEGAADTYHVILDQTLFFPEEGGQSPDTGVLGTGVVTDVQIKADIITHTVRFEAEAPQVGDVLHGTIDWNHRYSNMQNHTGEHIFSGIVHRLFGYENVGFHLSDNNVTMDYSGVLTEEDIHRVELLANEAIYENIEVRCEFPDAKTLDALEYRSKKELTGDIRIVTIPGVDVCACCAPHVHRTGEVGILKVIASQKYKGGTRLHILCGRRAVADYHEVRGQLQELSQKLSAAPEQLSEYVTRLLEEKNKLAASLREIRGKMLADQIAAIPATQKHVFLFVEDVDNLTMRNAVNDLVANHAGYCGIFLATASGDYAYIIGSKGLDSREVGNALREHFSAKGGGKPEMIQGSVSGAAQEAIAEFLGTAYND